jgi:outer membrane protein TolC
MPLSADEGDMPPTEQAAEQSSGSTLPQSERPTDQGFDTPPDYLTPQANPLLTPTRPDEVEIIGTQPLSLETAIELAYRNSEDMRISLLQLERSQEGLRGEQALLYPTADLTGTLENTNETSFGFGLGDNATRLSGGISANYDLGVSGERSARISAAEDQVRLAELAVEQTREELRLNTTTDYYAVQEAIEQIRINQAFLDEAERNLRDTQLREEVGVGTRFDVLRAEVQVANARQTLTQATSQRQISQRQLARRLNISPSVDITTLAVSIAGAWPLSLEESIVLAYQNRAELEQFLVEREFNAAQQEIQLSQVRPNLGLFAQYNGQTLLTYPAGVSTTFNDGFSVGAQLNWRLFDGGAASAGAAQSDLDIQTDEAEFENARNDIRVQVEEAYYTLVANQANIDTASVAVNQAQEALELATLRFNAGVGTQLDVLTATRELAEAEGNLVTAVLDYNRALARLERSVSNLASPEGS